MLSECSGQGVAGIVLFLAQGGGIRTQRASRRLHFVLFTPFSLPCVSKAASNEAKIPKIYLDERCQQF